MMHIVLQSLGLNKIKLRKIGGTKLSTIRKITCLVLSLLLTFLIAACNNSSESVPKKEWREEYKTTDVEKGNFVDTDGEFKYETVTWDGPDGYVIVVPQNDTNAKECAVEIQKYYKKLCGTNLNIVTDNSSVQEKEIIVGQTNRDESNEKTNENNLKVTFNDKKLVFLAGHSITLKSAIDKYIRLAPKENEIFTFDITTDFSSTMLDGYEYVWGDEFEGETIDFSKWDFQPGSDSTKMVECSLDKDVINVEDGRLKLHVLHYFNPLREGTVYKKPQTFVTKYKMNYVYGYVEIRARLPFYKGAFPSFWGLTLGGQGGSNSLGGLAYNKEDSDKWSYGVEVDIFEVFGNQSVTPNAHKWYRANNYNYDEIHKTNTENHTSVETSIPREEWNWAKKTDDISKISQEYHTYGFEWTEKEMSFYVDGEKYYSFDIVKSFDKYNDMSKFHEPIYLMFNNNVFTDEEGSWYKNLIEDHDTLPFCFYIDYIRLYQKPNVGELYTDDTVNSYTGW